MALIPFISIFCQTGARISIRSCQSVLHDRSREWIRDQRELGGDEMQNSIVCCGLYSSRGMDQCWRWHRNDPQKWLNRLIWFELLLKSFRKPCIWCVLNSKHHRIEKKSAELRLEKNTLTDFYFYHCIQLCPELAPELHYYVTKRITYWINRMTCNRLDSFASITKNQFANQWFRRSFTAGLVATRFGSKYLRLLVKTSFPETKIRRKRLLFYDWVRLPSRRLTRRPQFSFTNATTPYYSWTSQSNENSCFCSCHSTVWGWSGQRVCNSWQCSYNEMRNTVLRVWFHCRRYVVGLGRRIILSK